MKVTITSMSGNTKTIELPNKKSLYDFIEMYQKRLPNGQRVKITCDLVGVDGYIQGQLVSN